MPPAGAAPTIAALLERFPSDQPPVTLAGAAVTLVLREGASDVEVLLIERTVSPNDPASGQVALPGGHVADGDGNLARTALRELEEEVGLSSADLDGPLRYVSTEHAPRFGMDVGVFAGRLGPGGRSPGARSPLEVAHVFWLPRSALDTTRRVDRETSRGELTVNSTVHEGHVLWGFTRRVVRVFFGYQGDDESFGPIFAPHDPPST
jgi:8-oxo-dGTP pyrophosphatase MutT (NUDIX family)